MNTFIKCHNCYTLSVIISFLLLSSCTPQAVDNFRANWDTDPYSETFNTNRSALGFYIGEQKYVNSETAYLLSIETNVSWNKNIDEEPNTLSIYADIASGFLPFDGVVNDQIKNILLVYLKMCFPFDQPTIDAPIPVESEGNYAEVWFNEFVEDGGNTMIISVKKQVRLDNLVIQYTIIDGGRIAGTFSADICLDYLIDSPVLHMERGIFNLAGQN
jgi:hypothetical protein